MFTVKIEERVPSKGRAWQQRRTEPKDVDEPGIKAGDTFGYVEADQTTTREVLRMELESVDVNQVIMSVLGVSRVELPASTFIQPVLLDLTEIDELQRDIGVILHMVPEHEAARRAQRQLDVMRCRAGFAPRRQ